MVHWCIGTIWKWWCWQIFFFCFVLCYVAVFNLFETKTNDLKVQFEIGHEIAVVPKKKKSETVLSMDRFKCIRNTPMRSAFFFSSFVVHSVRLLWSCLQKINNHFWILTVGSARRGYMKWNSMIKLKKKATTTAESIMNKKKRIHNKNFMQKKNRKKRKVWKNGHARKLSTIETFCEIWFTSTVHRHKYQHMSHRQIEHNDSIKSVLRSKYL